MKAFTLHKFAVCKLTGSTIIEASYSYTEEDLAVVKDEFTSANTALAFVRTQAKTWFDTAIQLYVRHKEHVIQDQSSEKYKILQECKGLIKSFMDLHVFEEVSRFEKHLKKFEAILPHSENKSYQSSIQNLDQIKQFVNHFKTLKLNP